MRAGTMLPLVARSTQAARLKTQSRYGVTATDRIPDSRFAASTHSSIQQTPKHPLMTATKSYLASSHLLNSLVLSLSHDSCPSRILSTARTAVDVDGYTVDTDCARIQVLELADA